MKKVTKIGILALSVLSLVAIGQPNSADADWRSRQRDLDRRAARSHNSIWAEIQRDRAELHRDLQEYQRDRQDLRRLYRHGASQAEIDRKRAELRQGRAEIEQGRREISEGFWSLRHERPYDRYDNDRRYGNHGWWGHGNNSDRWGRGYDRWDYGRWGE
ncbi:MAG: hypothetical protein FJ145_19860 [Deltaproteobacteria bacterium]|nr:hypothetical protein [Deltaproteobacteria bacterium]